MVLQNVVNQYRVAELLARVAELLARLTELEKYTLPLQNLVKLTGTPFGTEGFFNNDPNKSYATVFDGNTFTYFDSTTANGAVVGLDLGSVKTIRLIRYYPRRQNESRLLDGRFEYSLDGVNYTLHTTIKSVSLGWGEIRMIPPISARFVRYVSPSGGFGNISEIEIYS